MVYPIPDEKQPADLLFAPDTVKINKKSNRKRKKKSIAKKAKKEALNKKKQRFVLTMSSWAEHFTTAATWQMKHELAYWKAKAVSLEYENKILHDIVRRNCSDVPMGSRSASVLDFRNGPVPKMYSMQPETEHSNTECNSASDEECEEEDEGNWEVSEEWIQFLKENAKFKEDARRERERLKAVGDNKKEIELLEAGPSEPVQNRSTEMKELYGTNWQKIAALEMSVQSSLMQESDKSKPTYWPNIPLNFC